MKGSQAKKRATSTRVWVWVWVSASVIVVAAVVAAVVALGGWGFDAAKPGRIDPDDATLVALGRQVYDGQCASCHGAKLEGQPDWRSRRPNGRMPAPPHDASGHTWHHPGDVLFGIVKEGVQKFAPPGYQSDMPAYAGVLGDREIFAVLSYIKSTWPAEVRRRHDELERLAGSR
jgi:mono/diheme cytochrome c family protein